MLIKLFMKDAEGSREERFAAARIKTELYLSLWLKSHLLKLLVKHFRRSVWRLKLLTKNRPQ